MTITRSRLAAYLLLAALAGWFISGAMNGTEGRRRPLLELIKRFWWVPLVIEPEDQTYHSHPHDPRDEHPTRTGADGFPLVDHRRAF